MRSVGEASLPNIFSCQMPVDKKTKCVTIMNGTFVPLGAILYGMRLALSFMGGYLPSLFEGVMLWNI